MIRMVCMEIAGLLCVVGAASAQPIEVRLPQLPSKTSTTGSVSGPPVTSTFVAVVVATNLYHRSMAMSFVYPLQVMGAIDSVAPDQSSLTGEHEAPTVRVLAPAHSSLEPRGPDWT